MEIIERMIGPLRRIFFHLRRITLLRRVKWCITKSIPMNIEITVAQATPLIPRLNTKRKRGLRITLSTAPISMVVIALVGYPEERIMALKL